MVLLRWLPLPSPMRRMSKCNGSLARDGAILIYFHQFNKALYTFCPCPVFPKKQCDQCAWRVQDGQCLTGPLAVGPLRPGT